MKKILLLMLVLLMVSATYTTAFAQGTLEAIGTTNSKLDLTKLTNEDLKELALKTFPEYEDLVLGTNTNSEFFAADLTSRSGDQIVFSEKRAVGDGLYATLIKLASTGTAVLFEANGTVVNSSSGSGYMSRTVTFTVWSAHSNGQFSVENFKYSIVQSSYDSIESLGTVKSYGGAYGTVTGSKIYENASGPAYGEYMASMPITLGDYVGTWNIYLTIEVGNNELQSSLA